MRRKQIKYNYALFKILNHIAKGTELIAVYNITRNTMGMFNIKQKEFVSIEYEALFKDFFKNNKIDNLQLTHEESIKFNSELPKLYQTLKKTEVENVKAKNKV